MVGLVNATHNLRNKLKREREREREREIVHNERVKREDEGLLQKESCQRLILSERKAIKEIID